MAGIEVAIAFASTIRNPTNDLTPFGKKGIIKLVRMDMTELIIKMYFFQNRIYMGTGRCHSLSQNFKKQFI